MSGGFQYTPEQTAAITTRGGPLLVSAAAGSGKTKVLVNRILSFITNEDDPCDIGDFLVITYTRAAAAELKSKIRDEISERLSEYPESRHLRRQTTLVHAAQIGTIHSFCAELLRENAHLADISPDFRVADENECRPLKEKVLSDVLDKRYETITDDDGFALLVDTMSGGRDDSRLIEIVLDAHTKLQSHVHPEKWVNTQNSQLELSEYKDASETVWGQLLMTDAREKVRYWRRVLSNILAEAACSPDFIKAYGGSLAATIDSLDGFIRALGNSWDEARLCGDILFPRAGSVKGYEDLKDIRKRCRAAIKKITAVFEYTSAQLFEDMDAVRPAANALLNLVLEFDRAYAAEKKKQSLIDFSDQEHMTAQLLLDDDGKPTKLARSVSARYKEILIDEYQDVNAIQELIFHAVSKSGENIFMVGDVKQSIYRFRLADPSIFLRKYKRFADVESGDEGVGRRIFMSTNFRSKKGVLDAVNFVFKNIMSESFGEMDYTEKEQLNPGRADALTDTPAVELDILDMNAMAVGGDEENPEKTESEAAFVASRIRELIDDGLTVPDEQGLLRRVTYGDFAILLRSVKNKAGVYAQALLNMDIPSGMSSGEHFFEALEVTVALSILDIIDNPRQDVPLITALKSPVYGFSADELAEIRVADKRGGFYDALQKAAETNEKCRSFITQLTALRAIVPDMTTDRLLFKIYDRTDMLAVMGAQRDGEARRENLMKLTQLARRYEANGLKGLGAFMTFVRRLIENGDDPFDTGETISGDVVSIMSIHKSKGLEFPVVILADMSKQFNQTDSKKPLLIHAELGTGMKRTDLQRRITYTTLPRMAVARKLTGEMTAEELRVLYVAMTRAREKLILVATFKDARRELDKLSKNASAPAAPQVLESLNSYAGYILTPVLTRPEAACLLNESVPVAMTNDDTWDIRLTEAEQPQITTVKPQKTAVQSFEARTEDIEAIKEKLNFKYPYESAQELPSKLTATELKGRFTDMEAAEEAEKKLYHNKKIRPYDRPAFITEQTSLAAAERGTALHLAMQYIDYNNCTSLNSVKSELITLHQKKFLSAQQLNAVDPKKIAAFFNEPIGQCILKAKNLYREFKFSLLVRAGDYFDDGGDEEILFQGVIDCAYEQDGKLNIIDFKTDAVTADTLGEKSKLYAGQVISYGRAMARITGKPIGRLILYFFATGKAVDVSDTG